MQYESKRIEYKSRMIDDIYKEVVAIANTNGGVIYLGIDDKGNLVGIDNVDETYTRPTNGIRDAIAPDVTMFVWKLPEILRFGQDQTAVILRAAIRHQPIPPCAACLKVFFGARLFS